MTCVRTAPAAYSLRPTASSRAFTLVELLITIMIIGIMASMVMFAAFQAQETAKEAKTRALVAKLDAIIKAKWDSYGTRRVPVQLKPTMTATPFEMARARLEVLRDLMRMELPDRKLDIENAPAAPLDTTKFFTITRPAVNEGYLRRRTAAFDGIHGGAECLYLIVMASVAEEADGRDVFQADDVADTDNDGMLEFVDGWGQPIKYLRWPAGFQLSDLHPVANGTYVSGGGAMPIMIRGTGLGAASGSFTGGVMVQIKEPTTSGSPEQPRMFRFDSSATPKIMASQIAGFQPVTGDPTQGSILLPMAPPPPDYSPAPPDYLGTVAIMAPDPSDPLGVYSNPTDVTAPSFAVYPLIYSAGPDKCYGIVADFDIGGFSYADRGIGAPNLNPFYFDVDAPTGMSCLIGTARNNEDEPNYVKNAWLDNIHNHSLTAR